MFGLVPRLQQSIPVAQDKQHHNMHNSKLISFVAVQGNKLLRQNELCYPSQVVCLTHLPCVHVYCIKMETKQVDSVFRCLIIADQAQRVCLSCYPNPKDQKLWSDTQTETDIELPQNNLSYLVHYTRSISFCYAFNVVEVTWFICLLPLRGTYLR